MDKIRTVRFNEVQEAELELLKKTFTIDNNSEAVHMAISWVNSYLKNVTATFFPSNYKVTIQRKRKTYDTDKVVY